MIQDGRTKRERYQQRWGSLDTEFSSWMPQYQEISKVLLPYAGRFLSTDRNRGEKRFNNIYDSTATRALRVLAAGLMAGMTSPARPWFRLATSDTELMEVAGVKVWLNDVTNIMREIFSRSNTYRALHSLYEELGGFGTALDFVYDDFQDVIRHYPSTCGEYRIATDHRGEVVTAYRKFEMQVSQMISDFGYANLSTAVKNLYDNGRGLDQWVPVVHAVEPRRDREPSMKDAKNMAWSSCYFEYGGQEDKLLRESGFKRFPGLAPRWATSGGDIYGNGPGMEALGDIKQLQHEQLRKAQGIDYKTKPPLQMPASLKNAPINSLPGGAAFHDSVGAQAGIRPMFEVNLDLAHLLEDIRDVRTRINATFYADLFLMLQNDMRSGITAREIAERHEEKLLMLGPVLERLHNELLKPLIDITFDKMIEAGIVPPPPEELQGMELNVEFVSMLAQAQRAVGTGSIDRYVMSLGAVAQIKPDVLDKFDADEWADQYADMLGIDPNLIVADEKVALVRQQRQKQQAAMQAAATAPAMADTAKTMSETDTEGKNALTDVVSRFSGYTGA